MIRGSSDATATRGTQTAFDRMFGDFDNELASTRRLLERFPAEQAGWRPHAKSRTIGELATHIAALASRGVDVASTVERDVAGRAPQATLTTAAELLALFDAGGSATREAMRGLTESAMDVEWTLRAGPHVLVHGSRRDVFRTIYMSHLIHHRAQLGVYLRLLEIPVPGVYGPTADEPIGGSAPKTAS